MKTALVLGAGGFIGNHLVRRLQSEGYRVRGVDLKYPEFSRPSADEFILADLRDPAAVREIWLPDADEVYQLAAEMGGAGYLFTGEHDALVMHHSAMINLNILDQAARFPPKKMFYASSACIYPKSRQTDPDSPDCSEHSAYPADPDSEYGWEKLFSERLYQAFGRNFGLNVRIARFHNVYGPEGAWTGGREKAPAAICRKVAQSESGDFVEIWGDGRQTRSFLYIDDCLNGVRALMNSSSTEPLNIGSEEMISIGDFTKMVIEISGKNLQIKYIDGPQGVRGRNSDNRLVTRTTGWKPHYTLQRGIFQTYHWVASQVSAFESVL